MDYESCPSSSSPSPGMIRMPISGSLYTPCTSAGEGWGLLPWGDISLPLVAMMGSATSRRQRCTVPG